MNRVELTGRLTKDVELRATANDKSVATFTLAVNRPITKDGEKQADFINCKVWNKQAENLAKYCHKGDLIGIEGNIRTGSYDDKDNKKVYTTEVQAERIEFLNKKQESGNDNQESTIEDKKTTSFKLDDIDVDTELPF